MVGLKKSFRNMDLWGSTTSILCAIHCAILPFLLSSGFIGAHKYMSHPAVEFSVMGLTSIFVYFSILKPYFLKRSNFYPFIIASTGLFLVLIHHFLPFYNTFTVVLGGIMIALGHILNIFSTKHEH